ncbi:hypothetical protein KIPB_004930, partial [Kipferlia bialata]|eukprot:g4930.t1
MWNQEPHARSKYEELARQAGNVYPSFASSRPKKILQTVGWGTPTATATQPQSKRRPVATPTGPVPPPRPNKGMMMIGPQPVTSPSTGFKPVPPPRRGVPIGINPHPRPHPPHPLVMGSHPSSSPSSPSCPVPPPRQVSVWETRPQATATMDTLHSQRPQSEAAQRQYWVLQNQARQRLARQ